MFALIKHYTFQIKQKMILSSIRTCKIIWYKSGTSRSSLTGNRRTVPLKQSLYPYHKSKFPGRHRLTVLVKYSWLQEKPAKGFSLPGRGEHLPARCEGLAPGKYRGETKFHIVNALTCAQSFRKSGHEKMPTKPENKGFFT